MKHIGIVDITTIGACICANEIVAEAAKRDPSGAHPEFTMHAFSFKDYEELFVKKDWKRIADLIVQSISKLKKAGAEFAIIPSNTPHYAFADIEKNSPLPVLNLIKITADECQRRGFKKIAVLGTTLTMQGGLYNNELTHRKMICVIPAQDVCERINRLILDEIIPSKINPASVARVAEDINALDCDAAILGCTELPAVYDAKNIFKPTIDTARLIAHAALDYATR